MTTVRLTRLALIALAALVAAGCAAGNGAAVSQSARHNASYPEAPRGDVVETMHGVEVADPYRWLEDPDAPESRRWIEAQNAITFAYLEEIPDRPAIQDRLTEMWDYEKYGTPFKEGGRYFYTYNDGLQNQSVLYVMDSLDGEPRLLLDPNKLSEDGTVAVTGYSVSPDGELLAYAISDGGSDWREWRIRDIDTGEDLSDRIEWSKFSGASWSGDSDGFYYSRYDEPEEGEALQGANYYQKLYYHRVGTPQSEDRLVYERPDRKEWGFGGQVTDDGRFLVINVWKGTDRRNRVFYKRLDSPGAEVVELLNDFDASYNFIDNVGETFYFQTDLDAPRGRVIAIDLDRPERDAWTEVIAEDRDTLRGVDIVGDAFTASYLHDASTKVRLYELDGALRREVDLPGIGSAGGFSGEQGDAETFYSFSSFTTPSTIYRYDVVTGESEVFRAPAIDVDSDDYVTRQVFYNSKDGTRIPMFITHKRGLRRDGENPTLLYGYGGFNIPLTPSFSVSNLVWLEMGGIYAVPNLRGGGEYGEEWHKAGMKLEKQNVFDDFIAAAEWLIANRYTSTPKLAIRGRSNGGLLVGACMTQRPDLFGACLPGVGVLDMLRFHKFTIGWAWTSDYGSPDNPEEFEALYDYSPYHNIEAGTCYPPTFIVTADHDDRVVPAHSFKFTAALQRAQACDNPILIRIETRAGHGGGKPTSKQIEERTDEFAFLVRALDVQPQGLDSPVAGAAGSD